VHGDSGSPARLTRMEDLALEFPQNVICIDGFLSFFSALMAAADFNCMPSLYEPHGGAYDGTVVPIARAVDGLAEQICALDPEGEAERLNSLWHTPEEEPTGFLFREPVSMENLPHHELRELLSQSPTPWNWLFRSMCEALKDTLKEAIAVRLDRPEQYARLVLAALKKQEGTSWLVNLGGMIGLMEAVRVRKEAEPVA
jgi:glycogen synthase